jgi:ABC-2 type transport system permease protein
MTLLAPLLFAGLLIGPVLLDKKVNKGKVVEVLDESGIFENKLETKGKLKFVYTKKSLADAKKALPKSKHAALLYIPKTTISDLSGIRLFSEKSVSVDLQRKVEKSVRQATENIKLINSGIDSKVLSGIKTQVSIETQNLKGQESSSTAAFILGYVAAFLIYFAIFLYGVQIMRGVIEEKVNRIIEVMISSVKPFQMMMGKIIGVALIGLTQFVLWIGLTIAITTVVFQVMDKDKLTKQTTEQMMKSADPATKAQVVEQTSQSSKMMGALQTLPLTSVILSFLFYFIGGYLLYSAMFAAVGSAADTETDTQQFVMPVSLPLIFSIVAASAIVKDPNGPLAFWMSMIPFTSPVAMMLRIPYGVATWEIALSMFLLVVGFVTITWLAGRIYRIGVLMYGKKVSFKEIGKWIFYKM